MRLQQVSAPQFVPVSMIEQGGHQMFVTVSLYKEVFEISLTLWCSSCPLSPCSCVLTSNIALLTLRYSSLMTICLLNRTFDIMTAPEWFDIMASPAPGPGALVATAGQYCRTTTAHTAPPGC